MKKLSYSILAVLTFLFMAVSCSKGNDGDDAASLLRTVPADAASVAMFNIAHTVECLGGSTDGTTVKLSKDLQKTIDESQAIKPEDKSRLKEICDGESGVAISTVVYFSAARSYVTGLLNDPDKFVEFMKKGTGQTVTVEDGAQLIGNTAVIGNQFWECLTGRPDVEQLRYYQQLGEKQSYASSDASKLLLESGKVVTFVADVNRSMALLPKGSYMKMGSSLIFNDLAYVSGSADIKKNTLTASAAVLDSDMKPAELLLPVDKLDASLIKSFEKGGDTYFAAALPKKLMNKISDLSGSLMGGKSNPFAGALGAIDGTLAIRANAGLTDAEGFLQTTGDNFTDLSNMLQTFLGVTVTRDGDRLTCVYGTKDFTGNITPSEAADMLKGAWMGWVSNGFLARDVKAAVKLSEEKKSLRLDIEAEGGVDALIEAFAK